MDESSTAVTSQFQCIECGADVDSLYTDYKAGSIKISHCEKCGLVADKYIEYDPVIIFLDALLLKEQAYRHLLINTEFKSQWRLALILWVCDAFVKLVVQRSGPEGSKGQEGPSNSPPGSPPVVYLGYELYLNYLVAASELLSLLIAVHGILLLRSFIQYKQLRLTDAGLATKAIVIASLGRLLTVPALLWGLHLAPSLAWLCYAGVFLSTARALKVVLDKGPHSAVWTIVAVAAGFVAQTLVSKELTAWLNGADFFSGDVS